MSALIDLSGQVFGRLTVLRRAPSPPGITGASWHCKCECGEVGPVRGVYLRNGHTTSCGCQRGNRPAKHGGSRRSGHLPEYGVWVGMRRRCTDPTMKSYPDYGGRGIIVCDRWQDFAAFLADMGQRPTPAHTIERVDNGAGYSPDNCIWATRDVQNKNRRPRAPATHCAKGHPLSGDNLYQRPDGKRGCRECRRASMRTFYESRAV